MTAKTRASLTAKLTILLALFAFAALATPVLAAAAEGATPISYQKETLVEWEKQLAEGQIVAVTVNKRVRSLRTTLKSGQHVLAKYKPKEGKKATSALAAKHVPVTVLTPTQAAKEVKPAHHKLRYIVGGIAIVVIAIVVAVLLFDRRRKRLAEE
jgi:hypothetical protein